MTHSFRRILAASHTAAVAIAVLLLWSVVSFCGAISEPVTDFSYFVLNVIATRDFSFFGSYFSDRFMLSGSLLFLGTAGAEILAAWLLSQWVYGEGPFRALAQSWSSVTRRDNA